MSSSIGIALLGCGVVGGGVLRIVREQRDLLRQRTGLEFDVRHIVVRDPRKRTAPADRDIISTDINRAIDDPAVKIVIEVIGGTDVAGAAIERALKLGKSVVTANKSLLAARGAELCAIARQNNACIAFEASCGGGIPIVQALQSGLLANRIDSLIGIINGTCNVILTRMTRNGWTYAEALTEAQKLGFAEADPTLDVSGRDAAQKLAILAGLAFDVRTAETDVLVEGIEKLQPIDIQFAADLGYVVKLLAIAQRHGGESGEPCVSMRVHPTLVHKSDVLAEVSGGFNAISVFGNAVGHALFYGRGAGASPTASAVVADVLGVTTGAIPAAFRQLRMFPDIALRARVLPIEMLRSRYYLRLMARDVPGTVAQITDALGRNGISISGVLQREDNTGNHVPIVVTTHAATEGAMRAAIEVIDRLACVNAPTVRLRIIDQPREFAEPV